MRGGLQHDTYHVRAHMIRAVDDRHDPCGWIRVELRVRGIGGLFLFAVYSLALFVVCFLPSVHVVGGTTVTAHNERGVLVLRCELMSLCRGVGASSGATLKFG